MDHRATEHHNLGSTVQDPAEEEPEMSEQVAERVEVQQVRLVQVWFGSHVIASYQAEPELAARYAEAMSRRFAGLRVTNILVPPACEPKPDLPGEQLWGTPPV